MDLVAMLLLAGIALLMLHLWWRWMFHTNEALFQFDFVTMGATGRNFVKGDVAGLILSIGILLLLFLLDGDQWGPPLLLVMGCMVFGRLWSLVVDGYSTKGVQAIVAESVTFILVGYLLITD